MTFDFYFPVVGRFVHSPSLISIDQVVQAKSGTNTLKVVKSRKITKIENFSDLLYAGTNADILEYLRTESLFDSSKSFDFSKILYLLKDKEFFTQVVEILRSRCIFEPRVWRYAFYHKDDTQLMRECLLLNRVNRLQ